MNNLKKIIKYTLILITTLSLSLFTLPIKHLYKENYIEFYDINGNLLTSEIKEKTSKYIYLNDDGSVYTGWLTINNNTCYARDTGKYSRKFTGPLMTIYVQQETPR